MLLQTVFTVIVVGRRAQFEVEMPLTVALAKGVRGRLVAGGDETLRLVVERRVDPGALERVAETRRYRELPDGSRETLPALRVRDDEAPEHVLVGDLVSALSFLTDVPLSLSRPLNEDRFVPEGDDDRAVLERFGTDDVYHELSSRSLTRTFGGVAATPEQINGLMGRRLGLRLYADALKLGSEVAQFRELWRVLESAFGVQDDKLVAALADYPPAQAMSFNADELRELIILRGRASHAASKGGLHELIAVERACSQALTRLKNLAERVILTKASWGYPTAGVDELVPLMAYVGRAEG